MKTYSTRWLSLIPLLALLLSLSSLSLNAGYRPTGPIETWKLSFPTEVRSMENPQEILGTLRKNQQVEVIDIDLPNGTWTILHEQAGNAPLIGTISIPDQSLSMGAAFQAVEPLVEAFPMLKTLLESDLPWKDRLDRLSTSGEEASLSVWDTTAHDVSVQESETGQFLQLKLWDQKDNPSSGNPTMIQTLLKRNFGKLVRVFELNGIRCEPSVAAKLTPQAETITWVLPNDIVATIRYLPKDHLVLLFESYEELLPIQSANPDPYEIADRMKARKYTSDGFLYLAGFPIFDEGQSSFGPFAALANVMAYYGYSPEKQLGGFTSFDSNPERLSYADMLRTSRRFCLGTPLHLRPLGYRQQESFDDIEAILEEGYPILLLTPGDLRIVTGFNPDTHDVLYYGSRNTDASSGTMSWEDFGKHRHELWILAP